MNRRMPIVLVAGLAGWLGACNALTPAAPGTPVAPEGEGITETLGVGAMAEVTETLGLTETQGAAVTGGVTETRGLGARGQVRGTEGITGTDASTPGESLAHSDAITATEGLSHTEAISATGAVTGSRAAAASAAAGPKPADMLTEAEQARAAELVLGSADLEALVANAVDRDEVAEMAIAADTSAEAAAAIGAMAGSPSFRMLYSQRYPDKAAAGRVAEVAVYRYDTGQLVRSKVDLASGEVALLEDLSTMPAPIVPAEIEEAATIARADPRVREALETGGLDPDSAIANALLTVARDSEAVCARHRCLRLFFASMRRPVPSFSTVVDMVDLEVVELEPMPGEDLNP